jgi:cytochrome c-type biogenesis protein CcmH
MTLFIIAALVMTGLALLWVLPVLLRRRPALAADAAQTNLAVLRDQFAELERDAASGLLSAQQLNAAREDLERRALEDARVPAQTLLNGASRQTAIVLTVVAPLLAGAL